jgi:hypothetical protein
MEVILYFHPCAKVSAEWLHDKITPAMQIETASLIATAVQFRFMESDERLPLANSINHPWLEWAMNSADHVEWLLSYYEALCIKMATIFRREDRSWVFKGAVRNWIPLFPRRSWETPPNCVPIDCRVDDVCNSYRTYYLRAKCKPGAYRRVRMPYWVREHYDRPVLDSDENPGMIDV